MKHSANTPAAGPKQTDITVVTRSNQVGHAKLAMNALMNSMDRGPLDRADRSYIDPV